MKRRRMIYDGKAKIIYEGPEPGTVVQYFKDDTTALDDSKSAALILSVTSTSMMHHTRSVCMGRPHRHQR